MAEYIYKDIAVKGLRMAHDLDGADFVSNIPAADVRENVKGSWVGIDDFPHDTWECDRCGMVVEECSDVDALPKFCPDCGADMRGGNDG